MTAISCSSGRSRSRVRGTPMWLLRLPCGGQHPVAGGQHSGEQLLGGGFAVGAGNGQHRAAELLPVVVGQGLQGQQRVGGEGVAGGVGGGQGGIVHHGKAGPGGHCLRGEISPPKAGAVQGEEQGAGLGLARIGADEAPGLSEPGVEKGGFRRVHNYF